MTLMVSAVSLAQLVSHSICTYMRAAVERSSSVAYTTVCASSKPYNCGHVFVSMYTLPKMLWFGQGRRPALLGYARLSYDASVSKDWCSHIFC